jgi:hypothetical protein
MIVAHQPIMFCRAPSFRFGCLVMVVSRNRETSVGSHEILLGMAFFTRAHLSAVNAGEKVIRLSRSQPEPVIQREPRLTGTR